jgi:hypothetical protein
MLACPMGPCHVVHVAPNNATNIVFEILVLEPLLEKGSGTYASIMLRSVKLN